MVLSESQIKSFVNSSIYYRGKKYYEDGNVDDLKIEFETSDIFKNNKNMSIDTRVFSENSRPYYHVFMEWDSESRKLTGFCDCPYYKSNMGQLGPCKHIIAVLLKYMYEYQEDIYFKNKSDTDSLIEELKEAAKIKNNYKRDINLGITFTKEKYAAKPYIDLSIGLDRLYIVKNIKKFLDSIINKEVTEYGKSFTFDPSLYKFNEIDSKIVNMLLEIKEMENDSHHNYYSYSSSSFTGKIMMLTNRQVMRFMNLAEKRRIDAVIDGEKYSNVEIIKEKLPVKFNMGKNRERIELSQVNDFPEPIDDNFTIFWYNNAFYLPPKEQIAAYHPLYNRLIEKQNNKIIWRKDEAEKVLSYIIPVLKNVSDELNIDKSIQDKLCLAPLTTKVYLDKEDNMVISNIKFCYDKVEIDPLNEIAACQEGILVRDIEKEDNSIKVLESFGFKEEDKTYVMRSEKKIISFLTDGVKKLQNLGEVYYSQSFKNIKIYGKSSIKGSISINEEDFLEFSFNIEGIDRDEFKDVFNALREKKKYFRLKNGDFVSLEDNSVKDLGNIIDFLDIKEKDLISDKIPISKYNAIYLDNKLNNMELSNIERNTNFRDLIDNIRDIKDLDYNLPDYLKNVMRNYQMTGFKWLKTLAFYGFGGILADEMGLGKTLQAIAFLTSEKGNGPSIVIAPTSLLYNWKSEIETFSKDLNSIVISGTKKAREELLGIMENYDVVITSYPLIRRDIEKYKEIKFNYCFLDEAQQIKNPASLNASSVKELKAKGYFALTGTPMENSLTELWSIFDFIMPGYLLNYSKFSKTYEIPIIKNEDKNALSELNKHIKPFILRRLKKDVIKELPPKIERKLLVEMTKEQKNLYAYYLKNAKKEVSEEIKGNGFNKSRIRIIAILTRLRQICCDPTVFVDGFSGESGKMLALDELLDGIVNEGHRLLLFSQFTSVLKNIRERLNRNKISNMYLDGSTKSEDRLRMVKEFNEGDTSVFLISLKAGGTGLNLTGADMVLHFDPWWNPAIEDQATDRAHRIGQEKTVEVIKLLAQGTIEEKIFNLQQKKKEIINSVIDENMDNSNIIGKLSQQEIEQLFI